MTKTLVMIVETLANIRTVCLPNINHSCQRRETDSIMLVNDGKLTEVIGVCWMDVV